MRGRERASRRARVEGRGVRLRERDVDLLLALAKMRLLRTSDLAQLFFGAVGTCQKRLRRLYDAGLVRTVITDLAAENRYALTPLGHALLERAVPEVELPPFRPPPRPGHGLPHLDLLNRYRIALATAAGRCGVALRRFVADWDLRALDPQARLVPDALVVIALGGRELCFAVEVDVGTEPSGLVCRKFDRYAEADTLDEPLFGIRPTGVLLVTHTARRARALARALTAHPRYEPVVLGAAPFVLVDGGLRSGVARVTTLAATSGVLDAGSFNLSMHAVRRQ